MSKREEKTKTLPENIQQCIKLLIISFLNCMKKTSKIYLPGHRGLVGSALYRKLQQEGYSHLLVRSHTELDLTRQKQVESFFEKEQPEYIFLAAAKVGGISANNTYPADFIYQNLAIQTNIIHCAYQFDVKKLLFLGSSCIYPKLAPQPLKEEYLLSGKLEPTNEPYAISKITGIKMCQAYNRQYGTSFISLMPTNLFGPNDNYHSEDSHVMAALIKKFHQAKTEQKPSVEIWGTGTPRREFLFVEDLADACLFLIEKYTDSEIINVGVGEDITIKELALLIKEIIGYKGDTYFNPDKPDGTPQKLLDVSKIKNLGWSAKTSLKRGIEITYQHYLKS